MPRIDLTASVSEREPKVRRSFLISAMLAIVAIASLAGCSSDNGDGSAGKGAMHTEARSAVIEDIASQEFAGAAGFGDDLAILVYKRGVKPSSSLVRRSPDGTLIGMPPSLHDDLQ